MIARVLHRAMMDLFTTRKQSSTNTSTHYTLSEGSLLAMKGVENTRGSKFECVCCEPMCAHVCVRVSVCLHFVSESVCVCAEAAG